MCLINNGIIDLAAEKFGINDYLKEGLKFFVDSYMTYKISNIGKAGNKKTKVVESIEGDAIGTSYAQSIEISNQKMYQVGDHFNKHGRDMGYLGKKEYDQAARDFFEQNRNTCEIYKGIFNNSRGNQSGQIQYIFRQGEKQLIINKETGQIINFYNGTSLDAFINVERIQ